MAWLAWVGLVAPWLVLGLLMQAPLSPRVKGRWFGALHAAAATLAVVVVVVGLASVAGVRELDEALGPIPPAPTPAEACRVWGIFTGAGSGLFLLLSLVFALLSKPSELGAGMASLSSPRIRLALVAGALCLLSAGTFEASAADHMVTVSIPFMALAMALGSATTGLLALDWRAIEVVDPVFEPEGPRPRSRRPTPALDDALSHLVHPTPVAKVAARSGGARSSDRYAEVVGVGASEPRGIEDVYERLDAHRWLTIPDLPGNSQIAFGCQIVLRWTNRDAGRVIIVTQDPKRWIEKVEQGWRDLGVDALGPAVSGLGEARQYLQDGRLPAVVALDPLTFAGHFSALPRTFFASPLLVVVTGLERMAPLPASHLKFALARFRLHARNLGLTINAVAFCSRSEHVREAVARLLGGKPAAEPVPLRPRRFAPAVMYRGLAGDPSGIANAVKEAHGELIRRGFEVRIEDRVGLLARRVFEASERDRDFQPAGLLAGQVVLIIGDDRALWSTISAMEHRLVEVDKPQTLVWWSVAGPFSNLVLDQPEYLSKNELEHVPVPAPVTATRGLEQVHIDLALDEGPGRRSVFEAEFGASAITAALESGAISVAGQRLFFDPKGYRLQLEEQLRIDGPLARRRAILATVSDKTLAVRPEGSNEVLFEVDKLIGRFKYYPGRVFGFAGERYRVIPESSADPGTIRVRTAKATDQPTSAGIEMSIPRSMESDPRMETVQRGAWRMTTYHLDMQVSESLDHVFMHSGDELPLERVETRYRTRGRFIHFDHLLGHEKEASGGVAHLASLVRHLLPIFFCVEVDGFEVTDLPYGGAHCRTPGFVVIDRNVGGLGLAEALGPKEIDTLLQWAERIMAGCDCANGCERCFPRFPPQRSDKALALRILQRD